MYDRKIDPYFYKLVKIVLRFSTHLYQIDNSYWSPNDYPMRAQNLEYSLSRLNSVIYIRISNVTMTWDYCKPRSLWLWFVLSLALACSYQLRGPYRSNQANFSLGRPERNELRLGTAPTRLWTLAFGKLAFGRHTVVKNTFQKANRWRNSNPWVTFKQPYFLVLSWSLHGYDKAYNLRQQKVVRGYCTQG